MNAEIWIDAAIRIGAAGLGSAMALVFEPPRSMNGFLRRAVAGLACGLLFAGFVQEKAGFADSWEGEAQAAAFTAFISWFAMGAIVRAAKGFRK